MSDCQIHNLKQTRTFQQPSFSDEVLLQLPPMYDLRSGEPLLRAVHRLHLRALLPRHHHVLRYDLESESRETELSENAPCHLPGYLYRYGGLVSFYHCQLWEH